MESKFKGVIKQNPAKRPKPQVAESSTTQVVEPKRLGRPQGKRSDPEFRQVSAWIRKDTYNEVTKRLIDEDRREFSDLVQNLLVSYLGKGL